ncbi:unnamed protein product [Moneuplotes crassus]|uniref:Uncharacterized protein n=1 Tax=Euplotes crassus TaxID=5936 RepID=A0AAD2D8F9_EUPCR|nr:unnamed protein product [Moneuplotes crassus]
MLSDKLPLHSFVTVCCCFFVHVLSISSFVSIGFGNIFFTISFMILAFCCVKASKTHHFLRFGLDPFHPFYQSQLFVPYIYQPHLFLCFVFFFSFYYHLTVKRMKSMICHGVFFYGTYHHNPFLIYLSVLSFLCERLLSSDPELCDRLREFFTLLESL